MKLAWHIARNDLRRLRAPLVLWALLIAVKLALGAWLLSSHWLDLRRFHAVTIAGNWFIAAEVLAGYLLVAGVLHGDVAVGTTAFWMTRPISAGRLLGGKLLALAAVFGAIPILVTLPWWIRCGYGPREIVLAAAETVLWQTTVVIVALPVAALTDSFSRYLVWSLVIVVAVCIGYLGVIIETEVAVYSARHSFSVHQEQLLVLQTGLGALVFLFGGVIAAVRQFYVRHLAHSLAVLVAALVAGYLVARSSPPARVVLSAITRRGEPVLEGKSQKMAADISLGFAGARVQRTSGGQDAQVVVQFEEKGVPDDVFLIPGNAQHTWTWADGFKYAVEDSEVRQWRNPRMFPWRALGVTEPTTSPEWSAMIDERRKSEGLPPWRPSEKNSSSAPAAVSLSFEPRVRRDPPSYVLRVNYRVVRPVLEGEFAARVGERAELGSVVARVAGVEKVFFRERGVVGRSRTPSAQTSEEKPAPKERLQITLVEHRPTVFGRDWQSRLGTAVSADSSDYFLVNRARGEVGGRSSEYPTVSARFGTVGITWRMLTGAPPATFRAGKWVEAAGWLDEPLTLAKVGNRLEARFAKELRVDRFQLDSEGKREDAK